MGKYKCFSCARKTSENEKFISKNINKKVYTERKQPTYFAFLLLATVLLYMLWFSRSKQKKN